MNYYTGEQLKLRGSELVAFQEGEWGGIDPIRLETIKEFYKSGDPENFHKITEEAARKAKKIEKKFPWRKSIDVSGV